jgi:multicomponent Na+:H+ antiporter subunit D
VTDAGLASVLPLAVVVPIVGAVASPLLARVSGRLTLAASLVAMTATTVLLALPARTVYGGTLLGHVVGGGRPRHGALLQISFTADPFGLTVAILTAGLGTILLLATLSELGGLGRGELGGYACLVQLLLAALIGSALTSDLFNLFVWFEVAALASYGLTGFFLDRPPAVEAAFKVLVLTTMAGFAVFLGVAFLYGGHGALNFGQLHDSGLDAARTSDSVALGLLICGFGTKAGWVPFHGWLADAHTAAPGPVSALFSGLMVNVGVVAVARLTLQVYGSASIPLHDVLLVLGATSALLGAWLALGQDDLKRLLAYDTVSQMGILAIGLGTATAPALAGTTYHLVNHALFKSLLFLCAGSIVHVTGLTRLSDLGGLARRRPELAVAFVVGVLAIAGVPPLNGYASLGLIHDELRTGRPALFVVVVVAQVVTVAALSRAAYLVFFRRRPEAYERLAGRRPGMLAALLLLSGGCVAFGILPGLVLDHVVSPAAAALLHPQQYAVTALHGGAHAAPASTPISFDYLSAAELFTTLGTVLAGLALAWWYVRRPEPLLMRVARAVHTGSVNDYAGYAVLGTVVTVTALLLL